MDFKKPLFSAANIPHLFLIAAIAFGFVSILHTLNGNVFIYGDRSYHLGREMYLAENLRDIFTDKFSPNIYTHFLGRPMLRLYPMVFDAIVVAANIVSSGAVSVPLANNITLGLMYALYPLPIYLLLRTFGFPKLVCGIGSLFSLAPLSGWGASLEAYYRIGLCSQAANNFFMPFAIIVIYKFINRQKIHWILYVLAFMFFVSHLSALPMLGLISAIFFISYLRLKDWKFNILMGKRIALFAAITLFITAFWFAGTGEFSKNGAFYRTYPGFNPPGFSGFNARELVSSFSRGEIFDNIKQNSALKSMSRDTQGYRWPLNVNQKRFSIFTISIVIGILASIRKFKRPRYSFLLTGFFVAALLLLGQDDVPLFQYQNLALSVPYIRFIAVLELFAICLAAIGLFQAMVFIRKLLTSLVKGAHRKTIVLICALTVFALTPVYAERWSAAHQRIGALTAGSDIRQMEEIKSEIKKKSVGIPRVWFQSSYAPAVLYMYSMRGASLVGTIWLADTLAAQSIQALVLEQIPFNNKLMDLFNIKYLIADKYINEELAKKGKTDDYPALYNGEDFSLLENKDVPGYIETLKKAPVFVISDFEHWNKLNWMWTEDYQRGKTADVFFIKVKPSQLKYMMPANATLLIADPDLIKKDERGAIQELVDKGGLAYSFRELDWLDTTVIDVKDSSLTGLLGSIASRTPKQEIPTAKISEKFVKPDDFRASISSENPGFYIFKMAYFNSWKATVNGRSAQIYPVSPSFMAVFLEKGDNDVEFVWRDTPTVKIATAISVFTLIALIALAFLRRRSLVNLMYYGLKFNKSAFASLALVAAIAAYILFLYIRQDLYLIPAVSSPEMTGRQNPHEVRFIWQDFQGKNVSYDLELYETKPAAAFFGLSGIKPIMQIGGISGRGTVVRATEDVGMYVVNYNTKVDSLKKDHTYYWRLRPHWRGKEYGWSGFYRFRTGDFCLYSWS
jgi:hypothetical protein